MRYSEREVVDLAKAWGAISLAFAIMFAGGAPGVIGSSWESFAVVLLVSAFTAGIGFLVHELAHKYVAQRYRHAAEFRSFDGGLLLALGLSLFGFIFAAPGAVMISGYVHKRENGIISMAGPLSNLVLVLVFAPLLVVPYLGVVGALGIIINAWLGLFNLLPFGSFDGSKILAWNRVVYAALVLFAIVAVGLGSVAVQGTGLNSVVG